MTDVERLERSFMDAMATDRFERIGNRRGIYDVSLDCDRPVPVTKVARATGLAKNLRVPGYRPHMIEMIYMTPCRRAPACAVRLGCGAFAPSTRYSRPHVHGSAL